MARYVFKKSRKVVRKFGGAVNGLSANLRRTSRPGMHGKKREGKKSDYALGLFNKNWLRACFGISQKQFSNYFARARKKPDTGEALLQILEFRLDNLVYRLGFAPTLPAARQMVVHGHIQVAKFNSEDPETFNYETVDRPSFEVKAKWRVKLHPKMAKKLPPMVEGSLEKASRIEYVEFDEKTKSGCFIRVPSASEVPVQQVDIQKIIEFASKSS